MNVLDLCRLMCPWHPSQQGDVLPHVLLCFSLSPLLGCLRIRIMSTPACPSQSPNQQAATNPSTARIATFA